VLDAGLRLETGEHRRGVGARDVRDLLADGLAVERYADQHFPAIAAQGAAERPAGARHRGGRTPALKRIVLDLRD
jgi:hypothetical protein